MTTDDIKEVVPCEIELDSEENEGQAPTIRLVNNIIERAVTEGASDIHIEPFENYCRIRIRID